MLGDTFANDLLKAIFNATAIANLLDNAAASPLTNLHLSLHTDDVTPGGSQTTNEAAYTGYARLAVPRTTGGFTVSGRQVTNAALAVFAACTAGSASIKWVAVGFASSGAGKVIARAPVGAASVGFAFASFAATDVLTVPGHNFAVNDLIASSLLPNGALPSGLTDGAANYVTSVTGNDITLSATQGGATLDIGAGVGMLSKLVPLAVSVNITPQFSANQLIWKL
jgi:hypothetical protein